MKYVWLTILQQNEDDMSYYGNDGGFAKGFWLGVVVMALIIAIWISA